MPQEKTPAKRKSHGRVPQAYGTIDPEFSSKVLKHSMELLNIRKDKPKTREEMIETISSFVVVSNVGECFNTEWHPLCPDIYDDPPAPAPTWPALVLPAPPPK